MAISIFAIVSVAVLSMFPAIFKLNSQTRADQAVTIGAKQFMEQVRVSYASAEGFNIGTLPPAPAAADVNNYTCTSTVADHATTTAGTTITVIIKRVTLDCTHPSQPRQTFVLDFGRPSS